MALNSRLKNKAFSLLELIITVAILSTGIVVVLQTFSYSARMTGLSGDIINAVFLAEDKLQELGYKERRRLIEKEPPQVKDKKDKFEWGYNITLDQDLDLYRLDFDVSWQRANRQEDLQLNTYLKK